MGPITVRPRHAEATAEPPALGERLGFTVTVVPPVRDEGRGHLEHPDPRRLPRGISPGAEWLGRPYRFTARVVPGGTGTDASGSRPSTSKARPPDKALPPDGVWAARVEWGGGYRGAMLNQGPRPTVGDVRAVAGGAPLRRR